MSSTKLITLPPLLDQYDDGGALLLRSLEGNPPPVMLKLAADMSALTPRAEQFALVAQTSNGMAYKYPIVDRGNTIVSAIYFEKTAALLPDEVRNATAGKLRDALSSYGLRIPDYLEDVQVKTASPYEVEERIRPEDVDEVIRSNFPADRRKVALRIKEAGLELTDFAKSYTGPGSGALLPLAIRQRRDLIDDNNLLGVLDDIEKTASIYSPDDLAELLYEVDIQTSLPMYYGKILDPFQAVYFPLNEKRASASVTVGNRDIPANNLAEKIAEGKALIGASFGDSFASELAASPLEVFSSLPDPHKAAIVELINV